MFDAIGPDRLGIDDFRRNGLLLPARDDAVLRIGLPLHRGPHRLYNDLVVERTGQIERDWARGRWRAPEAAAEQAVMRLALLQRALRRRLLQSRGARMRLNRRDPLGVGLDFTRLDAMAELLWGGTANVLHVGAEGM